METVENTVNVYLTLLQCTLTVIKSVMQTLPQYIYLYVWIYANVCMCAYISVYICMCICVRMYFHKTE